MNVPFVTLVFITLTLVGQQLALCSSFSLTPQTPCSQVTIQNVADHFLSYKDYVKIIKAAYGSNALTRGSGGSFYVLMFPRENVIYDTLRSLGLTLENVLQNPGVARDIVKLHSFAYSDDELRKIADFIPKTHAVGESITVTSLTHSGNPISLNITAMKSHDGSAWYSVKGPENTAYFPAKAFYDRAGDCSFFAIYDLQQMLIPPSLKDPSQTAIESSSSSVNIGVIIGAVVGGVVVAGAVILLVVCCCRRRKRAKVAQESCPKQGSDVGDEDVECAHRVLPSKGVMDITDTDSALKTQSITTGGRSSPRTEDDDQTGPLRFKNNVISANVSCAFDKRTKSTISTLVADVLPAASVAEYETEINMIAESDLKLPDPPRVLGSGGFGDVYAAQLGHQWVAVKAVKGDVITNNQQLIARMESALNEVKILKRVQHQNMVRCVGITNAYPFKVLYELCEGGDLHTQLFNDGDQWQWNNRGRFVALDIAQGLRYLHESLNMVHSDIKSPNVLLTKDGIAKLGDFGLVRLLSHEHEVQHVSKVICSQAYAAPEQMMYSKISMAVDVFSFGVVLLELLVGHPVRSRMYPELTPDATRPAEIVELVRACMSDNPADRPRIGHVCDVISRHAMETQLVD